MARPALTGNTLIADGITYTFDTHADGVVALKFIAANGLDAWLAAAPEQEEYFGCECEQDWNCGLHGGTSRPTWIETRYDFSGEPDWAL